VRLGAAKADALVRASENVINAAGRRFMGLLHKVTGLKQSLALESTCLATGDEIQDSELIETESPL